MENWYRKVIEECGEIVVFLAQTKCDLLDNATMTSDEVENVARKLNLKLFRTCVKENLNITQIFNELGLEYLRRGGGTGYPSRHSPRGYGEKR